MDNNCIGNRLKLVFYNVNRNRVVHNSVNVQGEVRTCSRDKKGHSTRDQTIKSCGKGQTTKRIQKEYKIGQHIEKGTIQK